ncbi:MAG: DMT family transporter [Anaerolineae bacterium]|nr:DMT family transporter [Thermoflexales bacterium]MDW8407262.1 DMT family transporter [Anaerolineae bacterium]
MELFGILTLALIWGSSFLFIKIGLNGGLSPAMVAIGRLAVGAALLWGVVFMRRLIAPASFKYPIPRGRAIWTKIALIGLVNNAIPFVLIAWGEQHISSGLASVLNASMPLFTVLFAHVLTHDDRLTWIKALGVLIGFAGVGVVIGPGAQGWSGELLGSIAIVVASAAYAIGTVYVRKVLVGVTDPIAAGAGQLLMAFVWLSPFILLNGAVVQLHSASSAALLAVLALGLLGTGLAYLIYYLLIQRAKASQMSLVTYLLPVTALIYGAIFLNEQVTVQAVFGFGLIVMGIVLVNRANHSARQTAESTAPARRAC